MRRIRVHILKNKATNITKDSVFGGEAMNDYFGERHSRGKKFWFNKGAGCP
jgi:hypothetical protein